MTGSKGDEAGVESLPQWGKMSELKGKNVPFLPLSCYTYKKQRRLPHKRKVVDRAVLETIVKNLPIQIYKAQWKWVVGQVVAVLLFSVAAVYILSALPWFLTPLGWVLASFALTTCFSIGHDCAHGNWTNSKLMNKVAGELAFLPLMHPFTSWCFWHSKECETLCEPAESAIVSEEKSTTTTTPTTSSSSAAPTSAEGSLSVSSSASAALPSPSSTSTGAGVVTASPMSYLASYGVREFFRRHYNPALFPAQIRTRARASIALSCAFFGVFFVWLTRVHGLLGPVHFWLIPLVLYKDFVFERWLEFKRRGLDIHLPAPFATAIASYNLTTASKAIQKALSLLQGPSKPQDDKSSSSSSTSSAAAAEYSASEWSKKPLWKRLNYVNVAILFGTPIATVYGLLTTSFNLNTFIFSLAYYFFTGLGITAGYHRLWAHRAYNAVWPVKLLLLLGGTGALEGSLKWWAGGHRSHHRYTDTARDPYNARHGFFYAHMGWMLVHPDPKMYTKSDIRDLQEDPMIRFQHTHYAWFGPFMAFVLPSLIAGYFWGDYRGGYFFAGAARLLFVHHSTFCVNSLAHFFGSFTYDDTRTPRDHYFTAIVTLGEGYHNFHHEFPNDYRNGIRFFDYDPTKWLIKALSVFGLTYNLREFPANEVQKGKLHMIIKKLDQQKSTLVYPGPVEELPAWTWAEFKQRAAKHKDSLVVVDNLVHDVSDFVGEHPGGDIIKAYLGTDATRHFKGESKIYAHSTAAHHLLSSFRVARIVGSCSD